MAITSNYEVNLEDEQFKKVDEAVDKSWEEYNQTVSGMIGGADKFYKDLADQSQKWADEQVQIQQDNTDFAIEKIEQQQAQAQKDYIKEQSGAYVDWRKQSNQYGAEAEKMASAGLSNTGFSESSQVSMYNTYQNRVATAREAMSQATLNYNNNIKEAILQNNAAMAEIYANSYKEQLELMLQGYLHNEELTLQLADKKVEFENTKWNRYQDMLQQINTQNALKAEIEMHNDNQAWQTEQNEIERQFQLKRDEINNKFDADQNELTRKHDFALLEARTKAEKEAADLKYKREMEKLKKEQEYALAQLDKQLANEKALHDYKNSSTTKITGSSSGGKYYSSSSSSKGSSSTSSGSKIISTPSNNTSVSSYEGAVALLKKNGVSTGGLMTQSEWSRRRNSYSITGQGGSEVKNYSSYTAYVNDYIKYNLLNK